MIQKAKKMVDFLGQRSSRLEEGKAVMPTNQDQRAAKEEEGRKAVARDKSFQKHLSYWFTISLLCFIQESGTIKHTLDLYSPSHYHYKKISRG